MDKPSDQKTSAVVRDTYPVLDPRRLPDVTATEEISAADILEALDADPLPSIGPMALSVTPPPVAVGEPPPVSRPSAGSRVPLIACGIALAILAILAVLVGRRLYETRVPRSVSSVVVVDGRRSGASPVEAVPGPSARDQGGIPVVALDNLPLAPPTRGVLRVPDDARPHRVFVDGVVVGDGRTPIEVACGRHAVRVGSRGAPRPVDVPCGGDVLVR